MAKNERAQSLAYDWLKWLNTRRLLGPPMPKHILAMLSMPDTGGEPPDAIMSADIAAFHLGVCSLDDEQGRAFIKVYCGFPKGQTKEQWINEGCCEKTYYNRAHAGADNAIRKMGERLRMLQNGWSHPIFSPVSTSTAESVTGIGG